MRKRLCHIDDLEDPGSRGFSEPELPGGHGFFVVRRGRQVSAWENSCPHNRMPLEWMPDQFLDATGTHIVCAVHGALFDTESGACVSGPCHGQGLRPLKVETAEGVIFLADMK